MNKFIEELRQNKNNISPIKQILKANPENRKRLNKLFEADRINKGESIALITARGIKKRELKNANKYIER